MELGETLLRSGVLHKQAQELCRTSQELVAEARARRMVAEELIAIRRRAWEARRLGDPRTAGR